MRAGALTAAVAVLLAAQACSSGGTAKTPAGYVRVGAAVSVARPGDWKVQPPTGRPMTAAAQSPAQDAQVDVFENLTTSGRKSLLVETVEAGPSMGFLGYHRTATKSITVKGAKAASRIDYRFTDKRQGPCEAVDVAILARDAHIHAVRVIWQRGKLGPKVVDAIVGSIEAR